MLTPQERIEAHIIGPMDDDLCWETDFHQIDGYPKIRVGDKTCLVHRVAWEIANAEPIPEGMKVLHTCDNRQCCNPAHLFIGTHTDNMLDMLNKNRHHPTASGVRPRPNGKWQARIGYKGGSICLGTFDTKEEALQAYSDKRQELHCS